MKIGLIGAGQVGSACLLALVARGVGREIVVVNRTETLARGVVADVRYGAALYGSVDLHAGNYSDLDGAQLVIVTAGVNEQAGGATDRADDAGRLRLLDQNAAVYRDIVPRIVAAAPHALILVVTDPPDPLADLARELAGHDRVLSAGTFLDTLRFRFHLARALGVHAASVDALVLGEHGTSQVFVWSSARVAGVPVATVLGCSQEEASAFRERVEHDVRYANITIIEGTGASQLGIGLAVARISEMILRDERAVIPIGVRNARYGVTLSVPTVVGRSGAVRVLEPELSAAEHEALDRSADALREAVSRLAA